LPLPVPSGMIAATQIQSADKCGARGGLDETGIFRCFASLLALTAPLGWFAEPAIGRAFAQPIGAQ